MNREEIIRMAREVGIEFDPRWGTCYTGNVQLERFAALVAAAEREACAKACEEMDWCYDDRQEFATAIRARGQA
jgi:hypothetical protein